LLLAVAFLLAMTLGVSSVNASASGADPSPLELAAPSHDDGGAVAPAARLAHDTRRVAIDERLLVVVAIVVLGLELVRRAQWRRADEVASAPSHEAAGWLLRRGPPLPA
jgi:hypothetical protein